MNLLVDFAETQNKAIGKVFVCPKNLLNDDREEWLLSLLKFDTLGFLRLYHRAEG